MDNDYHALQGRLRGFLRGQLPAIGGSDALARILSINPRTARNYLDRTWPGARQWKAIVRVWGRDVLAAVFDPEIDDVKARLAAEIRALEEKLHDRRAHLQSMASGEGRVAETEDS